MVNTYRCPEVTSPNLYPKKRKLSLSEIGQQPTVTVRKIPWVPYRQMPHMNESVRSSLVATPLRRGKREKTPTSPLPSPVVAKNERTYSNSILVSGAKKRLRESLGEELSVSRLKTLERRTKRLIVHAPRLYLVYWPVQKVLKRPRADIAAKLKLLKQAPPTQMPRAHELVLIFLFHYNSTRKRWLRTQRRCIKPLSNQAR
ncbi:hypothetical protein EVAR_68767_1 [Eumeta japonica]|uniref:Uncharacterized protein n=1 Tax=Eumeta variegata TaxID=151549 RepID=A0A4C1ZVS2_EUMVA|nr:hypothetical protein EVAR_68767_1 [Eumeta japonica]